MKTKALLFVAVVTLGALAFGRAFYRSAVEFQVPTRSAVSQYYSNTDRSMQAIGEGFETKGETK